MNIATVVIEALLQLPFSLSNFNGKFVAMKKFLHFTVAIFSVLILSSWTGGPAPECAKDSLAIVRVVQPMNKLFDIKPVIVVSKGECGIDQVEVTDNQNIDGRLLLKQTLTDFLSNGYTIQNATEVVDGGVQLNTYYLKKKVI